MPCKIIETYCLTCGKIRVVRSDKRNKDCKSCATKKKNSLRYAGKKPCPIKTCKNLMLPQFDYCRHHRGRLKNSTKHKARYMVRDYIKRGLMKKLPCQECGDMESFAHHPDHNYPLAVVWLCSIHHLAVHGGRYRPQEDSSVRASSLSG